MQECGSGRDASEHRGRQRNHGLDGVGFSQTLEEHSSEDGAGAKEAE
jgi:hypothetical protein